MQQTDGKATVEGSGTGRALSGLCKVCQLLLLSSNWICVKPLGVHRCAAFSPPLHACHTFDPTLPPCSSRRWRRSCAQPPPCSLFKIISEWSSQWKSQTAAVRAAQAFFLSQTPLTVISKKCKARLVCCTTCSILSLSNTHARTERLHRR